MARMNNWQEIAESVPRRLRSELIFCDGEAKLFRLHGARTGDQSQRPIADAQGPYLYRMFQGVEGLERRVPNASFILSHRFSNFLAATSLRR